MNNQLNYQVEGKVATINMGYEPINLLSPQLVNFIIETVEELSTSKEIVAIFFNSTIEGVFSAHLDLLSINGTEKGVEETKAFMKMIEVVKNAPQLTIGLANGVARGGGNELFQAMDLKFITENAKLAQPEIALNIPTGGQGAVRYAKSMSKDKALYYLLNGEDLTGQKAVDLGLATQLIPSNQLNTFAEILKHKLNFMSIENINMYKDIIETSLVDEQKGIDLEKAYFLERAAHPLTQNLIEIALSNGMHTKREITDMDGIVEDYTKTLVAMMSK